MIRSPDTHERDVPGRRDDWLRKAAVQESDIDEILADSFPASDAPPWTLGVEPALQRSTDAPRADEGE